VLMQDALRHAQGGSAADTLVKSYDISPAQARAVVRTAAPAFAWGLETVSLNRGGLADLVEAVGRIDQAEYLDQANIFHDEGARAQGGRVLDLLVGPAEARAMLVAQVARRAGVSEDTVAAMLPGLAVLTLAALASRARSTLGAVLAVMPSLGRWSKGSPHVDLADMLRRRCGGGPYASRQLFRVVRRRLARAGGFGSFGAVGWYVRYMLLRPASVALRPLLDRAWR
jgi:Bacterial protein of unknown function (DUF937)